MDSLLNFVNELANKNFINVLEQTIRKENELVFRHIYKIVKSDY